MGLKNIQLRYHKYHLVSLSPWPLFISLLVLTIILNLLLFFKSKNINLFIYILIFLIIFSFSWWRDVIRERNTGFHNFDVKDGLKWGILLFIFREVLFFSAWFWAFFHNRLNPGNDLGLLWPPFNIFCIEPFQVPLLNTCVLLLRGVTVTWSHHSLLTINNSIFSLFYTIILGIIFTFLQRLEYFEATFSIGENCYGSRFFVTTGFHGTHVIIGTLFLLFCFKIMFNKNINKWQHIGYEFAIWYWHFVDVVWLFLFFFIYWWSFYKENLTFKVKINLYKFKILSILNFQFKGLNLNKNYSLKL